MTVDVQGKTLRNASDGDQEFLVTPDSTAAILYGLDTYGRRGSIDYNRLDFPDLEWISPKTYVGGQPIASKPCLALSKGEMIPFLEWS